MTRLLLPICRHACITLFGLLMVTEAGATTLNGFVVDNATIPVEQIRHGGPRKDGIPALDQPKFIHAAAADYLDEDDRVLGLVLNGAVRAYPIRILNYHEVVNDVVDGKPLVITFCPLCGSGMVFPTEVDGRALTFGVSGLLFNSDVLLYDRQTDSLWSQLMRQAVSGPLKGTRLKSIPVTHTTWRNWRARFPDSRVLSVDTGFHRNYLATPYLNYGKSRKLYFPVTRESNAYSRKSMVMGLEIKGQFKVYPFEELERSPIPFTDRFQNEIFTIEYDHKNQTAHILNDRGDEVPTVIAFWFAWYAFHPDTLIYKAGH